MTAHEHRTSHKTQRVQRNTSSLPDVRRKLRKHRVVKTCALPIGVDRVVSSLQMAEGGTTNPNKERVYGQLLDPWLQPMVTTIPCSLYCAVYCATCFSLTYKPLSGTKNIIVERALICNTINFKRLRSQRFTCVYHIYI